MDAHVPTVSHIWQTANWHERETREMYGIVFDGHPDLRPLLTEEGLGYYPLLKSHPLADIEDWQEDYLQAIEEAKTQMAAATGWRRSSTRRRSRSRWRRRRPRS